MTTPRIHQERLKTAIVNSLAEVVTRISTTGQSCKATMSGLTAYCLPDDLSWAEKSLGQCLPVRMELPLVLDPTRVAEDMHAIYASMLSSLILGSMVEFDPNCFPMRLEFDFDEHYIGVAAITWAHHVPVIPGAQDVGSHSGS